MKVIESNIIYENPLPQLRSRQCFFPFLFELPDKTIGAVYAIGEAFESVDSVSYIAFSSDGGKTFSKPSPMFDNLDGKTTVYAKATALPDGRVVAIGYAFDRFDPELPLGNPENGGLLDDFVYWAISEDGGKTFSEGFLLEDDPANAYCYPAIFEGDDYFLTAYYHSNDSGVCLSSCKLTKVMYAELTGGYEVKNSTP